MYVLHSETALGVHSKSHQSRRSRLRGSWSSECDTKDVLPPKHPAIHRSRDVVKPKQVAFWDTDSTDTQSSFDVRRPYPRNSWSCVSDSKDQFFAPQKLPETPGPARTATKDTVQRSQLPGYSASCESDSKDEIRAPSEFSGIHRSSKAKQRVVSWEIDLISDIKSALNDVKIDGALASEDCEPYPKEVVTAPLNFSVKSHHFPESYHAEMPSKESGRRRNLKDGDVRRIVDGILKELRPPRLESISCSSSCTGCCSCCYGSCSDLGSWTPRPSTPAVDIPKIRQTPVIPALIHGIPAGSESPRESTCSCTQCIMFKNSPYVPSVSSSSSWMSNSFCSRCLPPFQNDSLDSQISIDSLNPQSIFSLDSLNSLTDPDSLEYSKTNMSIDSLDSLDSCCNYDSLSDSKDSGFFSCSLPVVC